MDHDRADDGRQTADALVMFGLTGDLGEKKLLPAIADLAKAGVLPGPVLGVGRSELSDADLLERLHDAADGSVPEIDLRYLVGDSQESSTFEAIAESIADARRPVVYVALPPSLFGGIAQRIAESPLPPETRLVVEKPFGNDARSAADLYEEVTTHIDPERLFIVDHFLAKSAVENLLAIRVGNPLLDAALDSEAVDRIELTMAESGGLEGRGSFYDGVGVVRDVLQNHLLQTLAVLLMESPGFDDLSSVDPEVLDRHRSNLLESIERIDPRHAVLGQYDGYLDLDGVDADSSMPTYVATRLRVDNPRWAGVDMFIRTGKQLSDSWTEIVVSFETRTGHPNRLRLQLKPNADVVIEGAMLDPSNHDLAPMVMRRTAPDAHGALSDYAALLLGAIDGDRRHFATFDGVLAAWRVIEPLLAEPPQLLHYQPGSMGPDEADSLTGSGWIPRLTDTPSG